MDYHDPKVRLQLVKDGIAIELAGAKKWNDFKDPAIVNASMCEFNDNCEVCKCGNEFSASSCELCGNPLGGERHPVAIVDIGHDTEPVYYAACSDCMYFVEYGQLDDESMMEIEADLA